MLEINFLCSLETLLNDTDANDKRARMLRATYINITTKDTYKLICNVRKKCEEHVIIYTTKFMKEIDSEKQQFVHLSCTFYT